MASFQRGSGILLHPTSLPSQYGIGDLGDSIFRFIKFLKMTNQKYWQVLPLGPTGYGDSPYQSFSSFAGNPFIISIEKLIENKLVKSEQIPEKKFSNKSVEYGKVIPFKNKILKIAFQNFKPSGHELENYQSFIEENKYWLDNYATFMALKRKFDLNPWYEWPKKYQNPNTDAVNQFKVTNDKEIRYFQFTQFVFDQQWREVKNKANSAGIEIIGDIPIFVAFDSADTWANQEIFLVNENATPKYVAGVPPDYFSTTGQLWGNPLYDWDKCEETGYKFWTDRIIKTLEMFDIVRIDHFRGFEAFWRVPAEATTAIDGKWVKGPGHKLFDHLKNKLGELPFIAEDLGVITHEVTELRNRYNMPGMKILQYAFSKNKDSSNDYLPHNYEENTVAYTGTHDNDTTLGWYISASKRIKEHFREYADSDGDDVISDMFRLVFSSVADLAIVPLQDVLRKNSQARMNFPGKAFGNWQWRFTFDEIQIEWEEELAEMTKRYERA